MKHLVVAVDCDDVLAENAAGFISFSNERWGTQLTVDDYDEHWAEMWGIDSKEAEKRSDEFHGSSALQRYGHIGGALESLSRLAQHHRLVVATSRRLQMRDDTLLWIEKHFPGVFSSSAVYFAGIWDRDEDDRYKLTKADLIKQIGADVLVDDQLKHCTAVAESGRRAILFGNYAWNKSDELPDRVVRCTDWLAVEKEIEEIANS